MNHHRYLAMFLAVILLVLISLEAGLRFDSLLLIILSFALSMVALVLLIWWMTIFYTELKGS